jgi:hypothetical protein
MRKAQAALEFLTTYGWAFIVILVMIGALAYFGVLNPGKTMPNKCIVEAGFECRDYQITSNSVAIAMANRKGGGFTVSGVEASSDAGTTGSCSVNPTTVPVDADFNISCTGADFSTAVGEKVKVVFSVNYTMARGTYGQVFQGEIFTEVR